MASGELKKHKDNIEVNVFPSKKRHGRKVKAIYHNILNKDPKRIAQILLDLETLGDFPIEKAVKIFLKIRARKDWLGF
jgi:hypothetical protein